MIDEHDLDQNNPDPKLEADTIEVHPDQLLLPGLPSPAGPEQIDLI